MNIRTNAPLVRGEYHDPANEKKLHKALSDDRYSAEYEARSAGIKSVAELTAQVADLTRQVEAVKASPARVHSTVTLKEPEKPKGLNDAPLRETRLAAAVAATVMAKHLNQQVRPSEVLETLLPGKGHAWARRKAATAVANTTHVGWAGALAATALRGFYEAMQDISIFAQLVNRASSKIVPFDDFNAVTIPNRSGSGQLASDWIGEGATIPIKQGVFGSSTMNRYKRGVITVASEELVRTSSPNILNLLEGFIVDDLAAGLDGDLLDPSVTMIPLTRPASITVGKANQPSAGNTLANILTDWRTLRAWASDGKYRDPVVIMHTDRRVGLEMIQGQADEFPLRAEVNGGSLFGLPILSSTFAPQDQVTIVDASVFASAGGLPEVDSSTATTLTFANSDGVAPSMGPGDGKVDVPDSINISDAAAAGAEVQSMFQSRGVALRVVTPITYGLIAPNCAYLTGVGW